MTKLKEYMIALLVGILHGVAIVVPGISGGTILIIFGVYDKCCAAMALDFKTIKRDFLFYVLIVLGTGAGVAGFSHAIMFFIERFPLWTYLFLAAMIVVGIPAVVRAAVVDKKNTTTDFRPNFTQALKRFKPICAIPFTVGAAGIVAIFLAEMLGTANAETSETANALILGAYSSLGAVAAMIPGVSGSFVMVAFGIYEPIMSAVRELTRLNINWAVLVPAGIGILTGLVAGARLVLFLLKKWRLMVYSAILGMVAASVVMLVISSIVMYG
jgi:putative membrane protein